MSDFTGETWLPVPNFPGYEVSDHGRVRSFRVSPAGKLMRPAANSDGYLQIPLRKEGRSVTLAVHCLVARAFIGPPPEGEEVRHLDGDNLHNRPGNLAYGTHAANIGDAIRHGTHISVQEREKPFCKHGHERTPENIYVDPKGINRCRICRDDEYRAAKDADPDAFRKKAREAQARYRARLKEREKVDTDCPPIAS